MKTNKGSVILILSVVVVLAVLGGGFVYYQNSSKTSNDSLNTDNPSTIGISDIFKSITQTTSNMSPKEVFIARNTAMYAAKSFEELQAAGLKYDSVAKIQEDADQVKYMNDEKKKALFGFAQVFLTPTQELISVEETITGETAEVVAKTTNGKEINASFVKENGSWKLSDDKIVNLGNK